jgi:hypothetical protein
MKEFFDVPKILILIGFLFGIGNMFFPSSDSASLAAICLMAGIAGAALKYDELQLDK